MQTLLCGPDTLGAPTWVTEVVESYYLPTVWSHLYASLKEAELEGRPRDQWLPDRRGTGNRVFLGR